MQLSAQWNTKCRHFNGWISKAKVNCAWSNHHTVQYSPENIQQIDKKRSYRITYLHIIHSIQYTKHTVSFHYISLVPTFTYDHKWCEFTFGVYPLLQILILVIALPLWIFFPKFSIWMHSLRWSSLPLYSCETKIEENAFAYTLELLFSLSIIFSYSICFEIWSA